MVNLIIGLIVGAFLGFIARNMTEVSARAEECSDCQAHMIRKMQPIVGIKEENERLKRQLAEVREYSNDLQEAFNTGDGSYHP